MKTCSFSFSMSLRRPMNIDHLSGIVDRMLDNVGGCMDVDIPIKGWSLFENWYRKRQSWAPFSNACFLDFAKVMVPNTATRWYDTHNRMVLAHNGGEMINLIREYISRVFGLSLTTIKVINFEAFKEKYKLRVGTNMLLP